MRLGIFLFFDSEGQVSDHVAYLLARFAEHIDRLVVVSNGPVAAEAEKRLLQYATEIVIRENVDYDVGGYVDGLRTVGFDHLGCFDEIVLFNYTVFGPVFDLEEMFSSMAERDIDFWGVTEFSDPNKQFLQSYFLVTRKSLHTDPQFRDYWVNMPPITKVDDSIHFHEFRFTPHFVSLGFKKDVYVQNDTAWLGNTTLVDLPGLLDRRLPIIKYRAFNFDGSAIERRGGWPAAENFRLLADRTDYPVDMAWSYIISQTPVDQMISSVTRGMLTDGPTDETATEAALRRTTVFLSVEEESETEIAALLAFFAPFDPARLHVVSCNARVAEIFSGEGWNVVVSPQPMTAAPMLAFADRIISLVESEEIVLNLSCFHKDRVNYRFREMLLEDYWGTIASPKALAHIAAEFDRTPRIGLMFAPTNSIFGRTTRTEALCPRAENWSFSQYPKYAQRAVGQANWPWRGNAVLSGQLARNPDFLSRLAGLHATYKHGKMSKVAGIEGVIPELARGVGFTAKLALGAAQAAKLIARWTTSERQYREATEQHIKLAAQQVKTGEQQDDLQASEQKEVLRLTKQLDGAEAKLKAKNHTEAELTRTQQKMDNYKGMVDNLVPPLLQDVTTIAHMNTGITFSGAGKPRVTIPLKSHVYGAVFSITLTDQAINFKGYGYSETAPFEILFVAVTEDDRIVRPFSACILHRPGIERLTGKQLPHLHSGFAISIARKSFTGEGKGLRLLFVNSRMDAVFNTPLEKIGFGSGKNLSKNV